MRRHFQHRTILLLIVAASLAVKLILIFVYENRLTLGSDDLNYVKSAVTLLDKGVFVFHQYTEPTVFITPLYPAFLAGIFRLFGSGTAGFQAARIIQAVISSLTIILLYMTARYLFDSLTGLVCAAAAAFYLPHIVTVGYFLTETIFTFLLTLLIYMSLKLFNSLKAGKFIAVAAVWALATLCRPTVALYPVLLFGAMLLAGKVKFSVLIRNGAVMGLVFTLIMSPWWVRNYVEFGQFIPLAISSGNPMLQGTYIQYKQTPENSTVYSLGQNALETDRIEVEVARKRIINGFRENFWGYLCWYTVGKTAYFWMAPFYWKKFFNIGIMPVAVYHYIILIGFAGFLIKAAASAASLLRRGERRVYGLFRDKPYILPLSVILYFNAVHCVYMTFDRYAFPVMHLAAVFAAAFAVDASRKMLRRSSLF